MNYPTYDKTPFRPADFFNVRSYYWQTRQWHYLRQGLPAVIISCVILIPILLWGFTQSDGAERYRVAFNRAVSQQDYETAYLFRRKLESFSTNDLDNHEFQFNCALTDIGRGQASLGVALIKEMAPLDSFGYGPAHLWLAREQISETSSMSGSNSDQIVHHLHGALRDDPKNQNAHLALGHFYHRTQNLDLAIKHLGVAVQSHPGIHFILANLHESRGDSELTQKHYQLAADALTAALANDPQDIETRVNLSIAWSKQGEFAEAVRTLVDGLETSEGAEKAEIVRILSVLYLNESDRLRKISAPDDPEYATSLLLLSKALEFAPNNGDAINRIAEIARLEGETAKKAMTTLRQLMAAGKMTPMAHVILGTASLDRGDADDAKLHFGHAYRLDPQMPTLLNNVAWMLAHQQPPELPKALAVVNQALKATPSDDPFYPLMVDTRGRIYVKMKRWQEALVDLEQALTSMPNNKGLHQALATTYRALGDEELASEHQQLSESTH